MSHDPDNMNEARAEWAGQAVAAFMVATRTDPENALGDLLCDLMHWASKNGQNFDETLDRARRGYAMETSPEGGF